MQLVFVGLNSTQSKRAVKPERSSSSAQGLDLKPNNPTVLAVLL